jgi:hypothetical protein
MTTPWSPHFAQVAPDQSHPFFSVTTLWSSDTGVAMGKPIIELSDEVSEFLDLGVALGQKPGIQPGGGPLFGRSSRYSAAFAAGKEILEVRL